MTETCKSCAFYDIHFGNAQAADDAGLCRSNPPVAQVEDNSRGHWPVVSAEDWCGRFEAQAA